MFRRKKDAEELSCGFEVIEFLTVSCFDDGKVMVFGIIKQEVKEIREKYLFLYSKTEYTA